MKAALVCLATAIALQAQRTLPAQFQGIGIEQRLNAQLPLDAMFFDENGVRLPLGSFFHKRPVVLALVYYECPMLCSEILTGVVSGLRPLSLQAGRDFDVLAISINPNETPQEAIAKRDFYTRRYSRSGNVDGWHFLTGHENAIQAVADAAGFHYRYDPRTDTFIHASGIMVVTPEGRLARYLYGVDYAPKDLKLSLIEAANRRIGSPVDQILLFCYHYDPITGKYGAIAINSLRAGAVITVLVLAAVLTMFWRKEIREGRRVLREVSRP
jgi:protein SCO1/2